jgi:murein DD-endopeptidase MepM/ murein hydrolase activator NlpD
MTLTRRALMLLTPLLAGLGAARRAAAALELEGHFTQGGLVFGRTIAESRVTLDGEPVRVRADGRFLLGFGRDHPPRAMLSVTHATGAEERRELAIAQRTYDIQRIDGLPQEKVEPDAAALRRIQAEQQRINAARARDTDLPHAFESFEWPALGPISGVYGSQRILNGQPRRPHFGVDVAAPVGTPLKAPAGGIVSLADADLFFTGGTVMIDHGHGLCSIFAHMQEVQVREGDRLAKGDATGTLGGTGRVTGPHLHWGMYLFNTPLDPQLLVPPMPA